MTPENERIELQSIKRDLESVLCRFITAQSEASTTEIERYAGLASQDIQRAIVWTMRAILCPPKPE